MLGNENEVLFYPIRDMIQKEVKNIFQSSKLDKQINNAITRISNPSSTATITTEEASKLSMDALMRLLDSNEYTLTLERKDTVKSKLLTGALIEYKNGLSQVISLIREGKKLKYVKISIVLKEQDVTPRLNPTGMSDDDYIECTRQTQVYNYYTYLFNHVLDQNPLRDVYFAKMVEARTKLEDLGIKYNLDISQFPPWDIAIEYLSNPLGMQGRDFMLYMLYKRILLEEYDGTTLENKIWANDNKTNLETLYGFEDVYTYNELKYFMDNPVGAIGQDFKDYMSNLRGGLSNLSIKAKYFANPQGTYSGYTDTVEGLEEYEIPKTVIYNDRLLFRILVTLNYVNGIFTGVTSEVII